MGQDRGVEGHVVGVSAAISDSERTTATGTLLADVKPTFSCVRLAQRVPVRIAIDRVPKGLMLVAGRTATVTIAGAYEQLEPKHNQHAWGWGCGISLQHSLLLSLAAQPFA